MRVGFNSRYMTEALASGRADEISLELNGPLAPCVLRLVGDDRYVHVLMPIRMASWGIAGVDAAEDGSAPGVSTRVRVAGARAG